MRLHLRRQTGGLRRGRTALRCNRGRSLLGRGELRTETRRLGLEPLALSSHIP